MVPPDFEGVTAQLRDPFFAQEPQVGLPGDSVAWLGGSDPQITLNAICLPFSYFTAPSLLLKRTLNSVGRSYPFRGR